MSESNAEWSARMGVIQGALPSRAPYRGSKTGASNGRLRNVFADGSKSKQPLTDEQRAIILRSIRTRRGTLLRSLASNDTSPRAYYVWRMARFHGGVDVTLPMWASTLTHDEPNEVKAVLDAMADRVAQEEFGSDVRGAARWGRALGKF